MLLDEIMRGYSVFVKEREKQMALMSGEEEGGGGGGGRSEKVREREYALQSLELAYHKYCEIVRDLGQGLEVRSVPFFPHFGLC